jgi:pyruvate kinase
MADLQDPEIRLGKFESGKTVPIPGTSSILDAKCKLGNDALTTRTCRAPKYLTWPTQCSTALQREFEVVVSQGYASRGDRVGRLSANRWGRMVEETR